MCRFLPVLFLVAALHSAAQVPGYMGMRLTAGYDAMIFPSINPGFNTLPVNLHPKYSLGLNMSHCLHVEYVVSRDYALGIGYQTFHTGTYGVMEYSYFDPWFGGFYTSSAEFFGQIKTSWITVNMKKFYYRRMGAIAPMGNYFEVKLARGTANTTLQIVPDGSIQGAPSNPVVDPLHQWVIYFGSGKQVIYFNHLIVNTSLQFGLDTKFKFFNQSFYQDFNDAVSRRLSTYCLISCNLGVGWVIF